MESHQDFVIGLCKEHGDQDKFFRRNLLNIDCHQIFIDQEFDELY